MNSKSTKSKVTTLAATADPADFPMIVRQLPVEQIDTSHNPRKAFDPETISDLARSIAVHGILQPLVVTQLSETGPIILIAGERRLRAAREAGLDRVPVVFRRMAASDTIAELALMENIQRQDLNPIEEALAIEQLLAKGKSQVDLAAAIGRSQSNISKRLALLALPDAVRDLIRSGALGPALATAIQAKWGKWPAVAAALAAIAVEKQLKISDVESATTLAMLSPADQKALIRRVDDYAKPTKDECAACPASGYVRESDWRGWCLTPACFDEKRAIVQAAADDRNARATADDEAARVAAESPPRFSDLGAGAFRLWENTIPEGCTDACPCRQSAWITGAGVCQTCTDRARFNSLQEAAAKSREKANLAHKADLKKKLAALFADPANAWSDAHAAAVVLASAVVESKGYYVHQQTKERFNVREHSQARNPAVLARLETDSLLAASLEIALLADVETINRWDGRARLAEWYLATIAGEAPPADDEAGDIDVDDGPEIDEDTACRECGCSEEDACPDGCYWVEPDLCSSCSPDRDQ